MKEFAILLNSFSNLSIDKNGYNYPLRQKYPYIYFMKFVWHLHFSTTCQYLSRESLKYVCEKYTLGFNG